VLYDPPDPGRLRFLVTTLKDNPPGGMDYKVQQELAKQDGYVFRAPESSNGKDRVLEDAVALVRSYCKQTLRANKVDQRVQASSGYRPVNHA
jgi:hypothetical protein